MKKNNNEKTPLIPCPPNTHPQVMANYSPTPQGTFFMSGSQEFIRQFHCPSLQSTLPTLNLKTVIQWIFITFCVFILAVQLLIFFHNSAFPNYTSIKLCFKLDAFYCC